MLLTDSFVTQQNGLRVLIDWISFTVTAPMTVDEVITFMGFDPQQFSALPKGGMGYKSMIKLDGYPITVLYDGKPDMGIHVTISGTAIPTLIAAYQTTYAIDTPFGKGYESALDDLQGMYLTNFLSAVKQIGQLSRLDLSIDDLGGKFYSTDDLVAILDDERFVSKFRRWQNVVESTTTGTKTGHTIYMGSRSSEIFLRVYDKQLEQNKKLAASGKPLLTQKWVRWELELKGNRANTAASALIGDQDLGAITIGILSNYFRVIRLDDCNRSRCSLDRVWSEFVAGVKSLRLYLPDFAKTLADKKQWIIRQVLPTIAGVIVADGGTLDVITDHFEDALNRMSRDMQDIVSQYNPDWAVDANKEVTA